MINPINHSLSAEDVNRYKAEPYVISADIYSVDPHSGRGGWSWYTGSAGWTYRLITGPCSGCSPRRRALHPQPPPAAWPEITLSYQQGSSYYQIIVRRSEGQYRVLLDDNVLENDRIPLLDDGVAHRVEVELGG